MSVSKVVLLVTIGSAGAALLGMLGFLKDSPEIVKLQRGGYTIEVIRNSKTLSQAFSINDRGSLIGSREVVDDSGTLTSTLSYFYSDSTYHDMPIPEGFTNVEAIALSDNDLVVGFASRKVGHEGGSLRAVLWDPQNEKIEFLPPAEGDEACHAQSISSDGTRIAGYSTGPKRLRPVLWSWDQSEQKWDVLVLETVMEYNPYLMSSTLQISPDGSKVAGCCTEQILPGDIIDSSLYFWTESGGAWKRTLLNAEQLYIKDMNNRGEMAGSVLGPEGRLPCMISSDGEVLMLELLPGDTAGEARGINAESQLVGWSDQPYSSEGGPRPCLWSQAGKITQIELSEIPFAMVYGINNQGFIAGMMTISTEEERHGTKEPMESGSDVALAFRAKPIK